MLINREQKGLFMGKLSILADIVKQHKKWVIVGAVVVVTAGVGIAVVNNVNQKKEQLMAMMNQTQTSVVERRTLVSSVSATGTVTSVERENVSVNLSGLEVKSVSVEVGDMVEAGQVLCVLDSEKIEEELSDTRTSLNVTNEKTRLDIEAAERNLQNAQTDYETAVNRGNEDLNTAYIDYADAVKEQNEAEISWSDAKKKAKDKKAEYDSKKNLMDETKKELDSMESSSTYAQKFNTKKAQLISYATSNGVMLNNAIEARLVIGEDLSKISVGTGEDSDFYIGGMMGNQGGSSNLDTTQDTSEDGEGADDDEQEPPTEGASLDEEVEVEDEDDEEVEPDVETQEVDDNTVTNNIVTEKNNEVVTTISEPEVNEDEEESQTFEAAGSDEIKKKIEDYISDLRWLNDAYKKALKLEKDYSTFKQETATLEAEYKTAEQEENTAEKVYDQSVATSESQLNAFEKQQRNVTDTAKNNQNTILNRSDSLYTSQLNSKISGDNERDKIKEYKEQLEDCTVKASITGVVTAVNVKTGDMYNGSTMVTIEDISAYEVVTEIDEYDIGKIEKGQRVIIKTNATGDEELEGTVTKISPRASTGGSEVTYKVTISIDTLNDMLRMDMTAKLSIILESKENVITVPYESVQEDENGKYYVEVVIKEDVEQKKDKDKKEEVPQTNQDLNTKKVYVEKGIESDYYIEIISNEIKEGMEVVVPNDDGNGMDIQELMMNQGAMGGF